MIKGGHGMRKRQGDLLKELLKYKDMKVPELSNATGIPAQTLYGIIRRNNFNTDKKTLALISKALDIPFSIWTVIEEETAVETYVVDQEEMTCFSKDHIILTLAMQKRDFKDIAAILKCMGMSSYTSDVLENIITNQIYIKKRDLNIISYVISNEHILSQEVLDFEVKYQSMSGGNKKLVRGLLDKVLIADKKEKEKIDEMMNEVIEQ